MTLAKRPRYANGQATRCSKRAATRTDQQSSFLPGLPTPDSRLPTPCLEIYYP
ncbi:hypothetical protein BJP36_42235 [Moorena producens JHB]|uniref:Uncharacterized protein n=1 Tax=Moorena producens (strain JHB) TaxID=1454205 RepID=A0A9Q9SSU6_MOOP1|nr:hypothetical protein [Moorena producens]WAN68983.1 hypothetical protein BJP36_42235 [Moorena producens JHB]